MYESLSEKDVCVRAIVDVGTATILPGEKRNVNSTALPALSASARAC